MVDPNQNSSLAKLQAIELKTLKQIARICEAEHIRYFIIGGTLIGAMRHKGFIPWDDDVDVGIPRDDYNRFIRVARKYLPDNYEVRTMDSSRTYKCYYTRVVDNDMKILWDHGQYKAEIGVWADVFPLDGLPSNRLQRKLHVFLLNGIKMLYKFTQIDNVSTNLDRPFIERALIHIAMATRVGRFFDGDGLLHRLDRWLQKYNFDKCDYVFNYSGCYRNREIAPRAFFDGVQMIPFEDMYVSAPSGADGYLRNVYGDYMQMPPPEKQVSHHVIITFEADKASHPQPSGKDNR